MEVKSRLIHQSRISYIPTTMPVDFYGFSNGNVMVVYSRFYEKYYDHSELEFVFALHEEFFYDYENDKLLFKEDTKKLISILPEMVDKPEPKIKILKVYRSINSYRQAQTALNKFITYSKCNLENGQTQLAQY
jgi:hypothetical protein